MLLVTSKLVSVIRLALPGLGSRLPMPLTDNPEPLNIQAFENPKAVEIPRQSKIRGD